MVNWKSKYLEMKLKYIKQKGGSLGSESSEPEQRYCQDNWYTFEQVLEWYKESGYENYEIQAQAYWALWETPTSPGSPKTPTPTSPRSPRPPAPGPEPDPELVDLSYHPYNGRLRCWVNAPLSSILFHQEIRRRLARNEHNIFAEFIDRIDGVDDVTDWNEELYLEFMEKYQNNLLNSQNYSVAEKNNILTSDTPPMGDAGVTLLFLQQKLREENIHISSVFRGVGLGTYLNIGITNDANLLSIVVGQACVNMGWGGVGAPPLDIVHFYTYIKDKYNNWFRVDAFNGFIPERRTVNQVLQDINNCTDGRQKFVYLVYKGDHVVPTLDIEPIVPAPLVAQPQAQGQWMDNYNDPNWEPPSMSNSSSESELP